MRYDSESADAEDSRWAQEAFDERKLRGFKYFRLIGNRLKSFKTVGTKRDVAGNRELYFDQYSTLLLMYFFNPVVNSLRGIQRFTTLAKVQKRCGVKATSLGSLSEAVQVFDPAALEPIIAELAQRMQKSPGAIPSAKEAALVGLIAVGGSLLRALPRKARALWQDAEHRTVKMHVAFAVFPQAPVQISITAANGSERDQFRQWVKPGGFYVADRGYANFEMFRELDADEVRFVIRVPENTVGDVLTEKPLTAADQMAGVVQDVLVRRIGAEKHHPLLKRPLRILRVQDRESGAIWILATKQADIRNALPLLERMGQPKRTRGSLAPATHQTTTLANHEPNSIDPPCEGGE